MELLSGPDLDDLVAQSGPCSARHALQLIRQGARGLAAALEKDLIHCDVKPSNLVLDREGTVKVTDFGLARRADCASQTGALVGTPAFVAPELIKGEPSDHRADIYALGITLYYLLAGTFPYESEDEMEVLMKHVKDPVPALAGAGKLNGILARMLAKDREKRYADYDELLVDIDPLLRA